MLRAQSSLRLINPFQLRQTNIQNTQIKTVDLLEKLNFIHKTQSGLFHYLPLSKRIINKLSSVIHNRLQNGVGAINLELNSLSSRKLWEMTNRWSKSDELFKLKDSKKNEYSLIATCEEDVTELMKSYITSYKDMPCILYQLNNKFRDEKRPRNGLLRSREFIMLDAYSFAASKKDSLENFKRMNDAFDLIFHNDLGISYVKAWADNGNMGGDISKEFHLIHESGEDTLYKCSHCNNITTQEKTLSLPKKEGQFLGNVSVKYALSKDHSTLICLYFPVGRQLNWGHIIKAMETDVDSNLKQLDNKQIIEMFEDENEDLMFTTILRVMDCRISPRSNFPDFPLKTYLKNNFGQIDGVSIVDAIEDEVCGECDKGTLSSAKSIEIGHTFNLSTKYSEPMDLTFATIDNMAKGGYVEMGCYGIGVSRLIGAIAEQTRDSRGLRWPSSISPFLVSICSVSKSGSKNCSGQSLENNGMMKQLKNSLNQSSMLKGEIFDSFAEGLGIGSKIRLSHAIGIPLCIIVGPKTWPKVEIEIRNDKLNNNWVDYHKKLQDQYQWEIIPATKNMLEKHIVSIDHITDVIEILLGNL